MSDLLAVGSATLSFDEIASFPSEFAVNCRLSDMGMPTVGSILRRPDFGNYYFREEVSHAKNVVTVFWRRKPEDLCRTMN